MRKHLLLTIALITILSAACGGTGSPISPSAVAPGRPGASGAVVTGAVRLGATAGIGSAADPMKVQVVGTDIVATVSLAGQFVLNGVPSGQVQLHFFGAGTNAKVTINQVTTGETITISVTVVGTTAVVESESRRSSGESEEEIEGRVESLPPTQPAGTFVVAGRTVATTATTVFRMGDATKTFEDLEIGQRVHVKGSTQAGVFTATRVEIQNVHTDLPVNVNGIVSDLTGSELSFQFVVNGRTIIGDHMTIFYGHGGLTGFTDLADGVRVEVKGQLRDGSIYAVRIHINGDDDDDDDGEDDDDDEFEATGTIGPVGGACPTLTFTLAGKMIVTSAETEFKGGCSRVVEGATAEVEGVIQADGTVKAKKVEIEDDDEHGAGTFKGEGPISSLSGSCPAISFTLKGVGIDANAATTYEDVSCATLKNGDKVEVKGTTQANGRVLATKIEK